MSNIKPWTRLYLYAIVDAAKAGSWGNIGINKAPVTAIADGPLAAVVSPIAEQRVRPERANLAAHNGVLKLLMQENALLPFAFGTIADSTQKVQSMLAKNRATFLKQLDYVRGKVEMGLRVSFDVPNIYEYILSLRPELRDLRDVTYGGQSNPARSAKITLGRQFDQLLDDERDAHAETVMGVLSRHCVEIKRNPVRSEMEVMNLACLIGSENAEAFETAVLQASGQFDNNFALNITGPWAPHNFVDVKVSLRGVTR